MRLTKTLVLATFTVSGCLNGPGFMKQNGNATMSTTPGEAKVTKDAAVASDQDGVLTATLDPTTDQAQLVQASESSAIAGSTINFPPGAIGIATEITVEEGSTLASSSVAGELGVADSSSLSAASAAMVISSSTETDAVQPFTVALVIGSSLHLDDSAKELVVLYKVKKAADGGTYVGVIPKDEIDLSGGKAVFKTKHFGSYQAVYTTVQIAKVEKATQAPIVTKREEQKTEQPTAAAEVSGLRVNKVTQSSVELGWKPAAVASGYIVRMVAASKIDLGCRSGDFKEIKGQQTLVARFDGLAANTDYSFRVCGALDGGRDAVGKTITVKTAPVETSNVKDSFVVQARPSTATRLRLMVGPSANSNFTAAQMHLMRFRAKFVANSNVPPADCKGGETFYGAMIESPRMPDQVDVSYRICSISNSANGTEVVGSGVTGMGQTAPVLAALCNTGVLRVGSICVVTTDFVMPNNTAIAGPGALTIEPGVVITSAGNTPVEIDVAGTVTMKGQIDVSGRGYTRATGPGAGISSATGSGGGAHAGEGGFPFDQGLPHARPYGRSSGPMGAEELNLYLGSGGGTASSTRGGEGGGAVRIRAGNIIMPSNSKILADGIDGFQHGDGGGAGGSIILEALTMDLAAGAILQAKGGQGYGSGSGGGGGSGGRVVVRCFNSCNDAASSNAIVHPGAGASSHDGAAGTIFRAVGLTRYLTVSGFASSSSARSQLDLVEPSYDEISLDQATAYLTFANSAARIVKLSLTDAKIDHSGMGELGGLGGSAMATAGRGPGAGGAGGAGSGGGGAGHAGAGFSGEGINGGAAGATYGISPNLGFAPGSGGGGANETDSNGGQGGGVINLEVDRLEMYGSTSALLADGLSGVSGGTLCGGGGSGGSIHVKVRDSASFSNNPTISAQGGGGECGTVGHGGGGGGGIIKMELPVLDGGSSGLDCKVYGGYTNTRSGVSGLKQGCPPPS